MYRQSSLFIGDLYAQIEMELLVNIGKLLGNGKGITEEKVLNWQLEKLSLLGKLNDEQLSVLSKYSGWAKEELIYFIQDTALSELIEFEQDEIVSQLDYIEPTTTLYDRLLSLEKQAEDVSNMVNSRLIANSEQVYRDIITQSSARILAGTSTLQQELTRTVREWSAFGIPVIEDKAGRQWSVEAYISMVIRATQKNVATAMQEQRMDDYDIDLIEISSHAGSRPSHFDYQGKIYSRSGRSKKYPDLSKTSYGKIDGIITGIHCGHSAYSYVPGISRKRYKPYDKEESEEIYKQSQKQRYLEREIRREKKALETFKAMGADENTIKEQNARIRQKQAKMRAFINETGRTRRRNREQIINVGKATAPEGERKILTREEFLEKVKTFKG